MPQRRRFALPREAINIRPMPSSAAEIIATLQLEPLLPEGGFFRRTYTSAATSLDGRAVGSAIYFLITPTGFSALHTLTTDELWHFYAGDPVEHLMLAPDGAVTRTVLGVDFARAHRPQLVVPGGVCQGARLAHGGAWALLGCTLAPAWDDREFTLADRAALLVRYPAATDDIRALTR